MERFPVCFHAIILKILISENHKAQPLSAEADSYVKKHIIHCYLFDLKKPPMKCCWIDATLYTIMK